MKTVLAIFGVLFLAVVIGFLAMAWWGGMIGDIYDDDDPQTRWPEHHND